MLREIKSRLARIIRADFVRSVLLLVGGTAFAQALSVLILPVLTRLYAPEHFSALAVYSSLLAVIGSVACFRYEIAISLPEADRDAAALMLLALFSAAFWGLLTGGVLYFFASDFFELIGHPELTAFSWLLPLGVWLQGSYSALQYWASRNKQFGRVARTRLSQAVTGATTQVFLGWAGLAPLGLVLGHFLSSSAGVLGLTASAVKSHRSTISSVTFRQVKTIASEYIRFPKYSTFEALANSGGVQLPVLLIAALAAGPEAGYLLLALRVMAAPMGLVGGAIAQVYLSGAPAQKREGTLGAFTSSVISGLIRTGVGPLVLFGIVAPSIFPVVFGSEWLRAGELISWMTPWFVMQFVSSPVSMALHVTNNQALALYLQLFGLFLRIGFVLLAFYFLPEATVEAYAASGFVFYSVYLFLVLRAVGVKVDFLLERCRKGFLVVFLWVGAALMLLSLVDGWVIK